jgi:outer membrane lipoprotein-sorting protein
MILSRWRSIPIMFMSLFLALLLLAACGADTQKAQIPPTPLPSPSPTPTQGQQILARTANALNSAKTLQGLFNLTITGQAINGTLNTEVWNANPSKNRTEIRQSTLSQVPSGTVTVTDGKKMWQYDPVKNVVYSGPVQPTGNNSSSLGSSGNGQGQFVVNLVQNVFSHSDGTLKSSTATVNNHAVYDIGVVPQGNVATAGPGNFSYSGDVYVDKGTQLPVRVKLNIQGLGNVLLDLPQLTLNQPIPDSTFTFATPAGAKELPLQQATQTTGGGLISLAQAQQQADFHLLSIPGDQADYVLQGVNILGAPGSQIYTLHYMKGSTSFTITQGKPLANLSASSGQKIDLRGTTGLLSSQSGNNVLIWTEKGVGINITGPLSNDQLVTIAKALA